MLASIASSRRRALRQLHHHTLKQHADLVLHLASLGRRGVRKPSEQSRHRGYVLACPDEAWEPVIVLDNSPMLVASMSAHLIMVLCDLMLERHGFLL
jgi:hypothetical protein